MSQAKARRTVGIRIAAAMVFFACIPGVLASGMWSGSSATSATGVLPDGTPMPLSAFLDPASVSGPAAWFAGPADSSTGNLEPGVVVDATAAQTGGSLLGIDNAASGDGFGIPGPALAAYQRAETVINAADPTCRLPWALLAAIGRVESNHGQFGGSTVGTDGVVTPPIIGIALDGSSGTTKIADTDDGTLDQDTTWDRAVGPLQFIPSTWSSVGVDADGDQIRNPQDIDDAALAAAVYLCAGSDDLSTIDGQRGAIYRYNHSNSYVTLVLSIMADYGSLGTVANVDSPSPGVITPPSVPSPTTPSGSTKPNKPKPSKAPATQPGDDPNRPELPPVEPPPSVTLLSPAEAAAQCTSEGKVDNPLRSGDAFDLCVANYTGG